MSPEEERRWVEALEWHGLRQGDEPLTAEQEDAWRQWVADPQNRYIYESCAQLHAATLQIGTSRVWLRRWQLEKRPSPTRRRLRWSVVSTVLAVAFALLVLRLEHHLPLHRSISVNAPAVARIAAAPALAVPYRTGIGQTRIIRLADDSTITLGPKTALRVISGRIDGPWIWSRARRGSR